MLQDIKRTKDTIFEAKKLVEAGGDWDRRNKLKASDVTLTQHSTLNTHHSSVNTQHSALKTQNSTLKHSTLNT